MTAEARQHVFGEEMGSESGVLRTAGLRGYGQIAETNFSTY